MTTLHFVQKARKDYPDHGIKKGESYYWWKFAYGQKQFSKEKPRRSRLTQSAFQASICDIEDDIAEFSASDQDEIESFVDDIKSRLEEMKDECESNLDNMPDTLRESSSSGQLLQERIDMLEQAISEFESIETDIDEDGIKDEAREEIESENTDDEKEISEDDVDERFEEKLSNRVDEIVDEIRSVSIG